MIPWWGIALAAAAVLVLLGGEVAPVLTDFLATITGRGARVGPSTRADDLGVIRVDPGQLADAAALYLDTYALARMIASEEGPSPTIDKVAVGWAAVNHSGGSVASALLKGKGDADGYFARQNARYRTGAVDDDGNDVTASAGKYAATDMDPHEDDVSIARAILEGAIPDPTGGATNFFRPVVQDRGYNLGLSGYTKTAAEVDAAWTAGGLERVAVDGIGDDLWFYRRRA